MHRQTLRTAAGLALAILGVGIAPAADAPATAAASAAAAAAAEWAAPKLPARSTLSSTGRNPYFILEPGYQLVLAKPDGSDHLIVTVLDQTKEADGVETRVVEERETEGGKLVEVSRNYFAVSRETGDLYYFGEDVDMYKHDKVTGHGGSWLAGVNGAKAGLMIPGKPAPGMRFYQEQAPDVAMDRSEVVSVTETMTTPAGNFKDCLKVADSSAIEKGDPESKVYAPGVGLLADEDFRLVKYGPIEKGK